MILRCHQESKRQFEGVVNLAIVDAKREAFAHAREGGQDAIATWRYVNVKIADRLNEATVKRDLLLGLTQRGRSRTRIDSLNLTARKRNLRRVVRKLGGALRTPRAMIGTSTAAVRIGRIAAIAAITAGSAS